MQYLNQLDLSDYSATNVHQEEVHLFFTSMSIQTSSDLLECFFA